jgi:hypothetical protein
VLFRSIYYCQTVACLLMWGAVSDERTVLSFTSAAGARQRNHSRVRVPCDSRPYFTVSGMRLPSSSHPTTRRTTVEVIDPASTQDWVLLVSSIPEVGSDRIISRSPPSRVDLSRSSLLLCAGSSLSCIPAFNSLKLHYAFQNSSHRSSVVDCFT